MDLISIKGLSVWKTKKHDPEGMIINSLSFKISSGEVVTISGPNGCGKTTLLKFICGVQDANLDHTCDSFVKATELQVGYVPQNTNMAICNWLNVLDNICIVDRLKGVKLDDARKTAYDTFNSLDLKFELFQSGSALSGGQKFLTVLAREINRKPDLLIVDEGFSSLEMEFRINLLEMLNKFVKKRGKALLMVSHYPLEAFPFSSRILLFPKSPLGSLNYLNIAVDEQHQEMANSINEYQGKMLEMWHQSSC